MKEGNALGAMENSQTVDDLRTRIIDGCMALRSGQKMRILADVFESAFRSISGFYSEINGFQAWRDGDGFVVKRDVEE
jgi:hypothetical protein